MSPRPTAALLLLAAGGGTGGVPSRPLSRPFASPSSAGGGGGGGGGGAAVVAAASPPSPRRRRWPRSPGRSPHRPRRAEGSQGDEGEEADAEGGGEGEGGERGEEEWYLPPSEPEEWYLPSLKVQIATTWLFGSGDVSEWGGADPDPNAAAAANATDDDPPAAIPIEIPSLLEGEYVTDVSAGGTHSAALTSEGRIFTAGTSAGSEERGMGRDADDGAALGFAPISEAHDLDGVPTADLPRFAKVAASTDYTFAIDEDGNAWSAGSNAYGQLCLNDTASRDRFRRVSMPGAGAGANPFDPPIEIADVALGERHALLLGADGRVWGCGWNPYGQLGVGLKGEDAAMPVEVVIDAPDGEGAENGTGINGTIVQVAAGRGSSYFLTSSGHVYAAGTNYRGQLCLGHRNDTTLPAMLSGLNVSSNGTNVASIAAGASSLYLLLSDGSVLACGENTQGQLGLGEGAADSVDVPTPIPNVTDITGIFSGPTSLGAYFASDRVVYAVGFDGIGARENWDVPDLVACADGGTAPMEGLVVSTSNDVTLYLATTETSFACEAENATTGAPTATPSPAGSRAPASSSSASSAPTGSGTPTTIAPTASPTASLRPSSSASPTGETRAPTTPSAAFDGPSPVPSSSHAPSGGDQTKPPPVRADPVADSAGGPCSSSSFGPFFMGVVAFLWMSII
ncbi:hypothetical protein ACHAWF_010317 [Thalassiosira exigua]